MRNKKLVLLFIWLFVYLFIFKKQSYAYFSPQTLLLAKLSVGSFFWQFLVSFLVLGFSFFLKFTKFIKKNFLIIFTGLIFLTVSGFIISRFIFLKKANEIGPIIPTTPELVRFYAAQEKELIGIVKRQVGEVPRKNYLSYQGYVEKRFLDLDKLNIKDLEKYRILGAFASWDVSLKNQLGDLPATEVLQDAQKSINKYKINKDKDKVLIYCYHGNFTSKFAYIYYLLGYDTYYYGIKDLQRNDLIDTKKILEVAKNNSIVLDKLGNIDKITNYKLLIFGFALDYDYDKPLYDNKNINLEVLILNSKSPTGGSSVDEFDMLHAPNVIALPSQELKMHLEENYQKTKIICTSDLNCLLTQHFLYNMNLVQKFSVIYQSCLADTAGRTRCK